MAAKNTLQFFLGPLLKKFFQDMGRDPNNLEMLLIRQKAGQLLKDSNKVINFPQKRSFKEEIEAMKKSGDLVDKDNMIISEKITDREMFKNSNLNKPTIEGQMEKITGASNRIKEIQKEIDEMYRPKTDAEIKAKFDKQNQESIQRFKDKMKKDDPEDKADGGRIGFRAGKFVLDKIIAKLLSDPKKVKQAADDIFPTGDYKYDAQMAAEALVENNPRIFKNRLYDDLDLDTQIEIYGAVLEPIQKNMALMRQLKKASKPTKTLESIKETGTIDISDPNVADEFARFMKETDPAGSKKLEQTVELANFDPKGRKKNATGGRAGYSLGSMVSQARQDSDGIEARLEQLGGDVTSAEQMLQQINERLETAGSSIPEGGGSGIGSLPTQMPIGQAPNMSPLENAMRGSLPAIPQPGTQPQLGPTGLKLDQPFSGETFNQVPEEFKSGYADYMKDKPIPMGGQAMSSVALPDGNRVMFGDTGSAGSFRDYLKSTGFTPPSPLGQPLQSPLQTASSQQNMQKALPGLFAKGGRAGFYTGGITDVEPSLDDIGHGSDSLMSRTRLMSPGSQATTSTGLNYLLAEDNDNLRVPFAGGGDPKRRAFLKLLATLTGGIAGIKSGILGLGEGGAKKAVTETVKQSAGNYPPPYFYKLVEKIKFMGDDTLASKDKARAYKYKDYVLEEDFAGNIEIIKKNMDEMYPEEVYIKYTADDTGIKNKKGFARNEDYEEFTARPDGDGKMKDVEQGVPDDVIDEAGDTTAMTLKKAEGGRIGFKIGGSGKKFIEKIFGKGSLDVMKARDPELHKGMLEVVDMFRNRDKEGLKMYLQKFLPHMDDETIEAFIVGDAADAAGQGKYGLDNIQGQLIRLGSGRDYAGKIEMMKKADNMRKLDKLDVDKMKPNANGGLITMLGE